MGRTLPTVLAIAILIVAPAPAADRFGTALAIAGDVNDDGFDDVLVGAYGWHDGTGQVGAAFVYHGGPDGPSTVASWTVVGPAVGSSYGYAVSSAGDVNGDGFADIVVGAPGATGGLGRVEVFHGSAGGLSNVPAWSVDGSAGTFVARSVAGRFDMDADGYDDAGYLVSFGDGSGNEVRVHRGSASGLSATHDWSFVVNDKQLGGAGDFDDDGFDDLILFEPDGGWDVRRGSMTGPVAFAGLYHELPSYDYPPNVSAPAGDVNGDGAEDVVAGFGGGDGAYGYYGPDLQNPADPFYVDWEVTGARSFGTGISTAGDVDGDGIDDVAVGVPQWGGSRGQVQVFRGSADGLAVSPSWSVEALEEYTEFGFVTAGGGDVNGDGFDDVLVGSNAGQLLFPSLERAWVFAGSAGGVVSDPLWTVYGRGPAPSPRLLSQLRVTKYGTNVGVSWGYDTCRPGFYDNQLYQGTLGDYTSHQPVDCVLDGDISTSFTPLAASAYFLIVPHNGASEGSYGLDSDGDERGQGTSFCRPQRVSCD